MAAVSAETISYLRDEMNRASVDMITATSQLHQDAVAIRAEQPNWRAYLQSVLSVS